MKNPTTKYYLHKMPSKPNNLHYFVQVPSNLTKQSFIEKSLIFFKRI